jgi:uncharacterized membrane-anchored protein
MSVVMVTNNSTLDLYKPEIEAVLEDFSYKKGKRYAEYVQGDKVAKIGLTALIAGGTATVAAKTGLLKVALKYIKFIIVGIIAFFAALRKKIMGIFKKE